MQLGLAKWIAHMIRDKLEDFPGLEKVLGWKINGLSKPTIHKVSSSFMIMLFKQNWKARDGNHSMKSFNIVLAIFLDSVFNPTLDSVALYNR